LETAVKALRLRWQFAARRGGACASLARAMAALNGERIRHTVVFDLRHGAASEEEADFLAAAERLAAVPGVEAFELLREVSPKNGYRFGLSMEFADEAAYAAYNDHPDHIRFVEQRWLPEVSDFFESDYAAQ
jgi:heme-degrading monooxygenase HmoA